MDKKEETTRAERNSTKRPSNLNNALVKKLLQDDTKKQDSDTKKEDDSRLDGYDSKTS